jgi:outer membrane protein insertion porin family
MVAAESVRLVTGSRHRYPSLSMRSPPHHSPGRHGALSGEERIRGSFPGRVLAAVLAAAVLLVATSPAARAQEFGDLENEALRDRPIGSVRLEGLDRIQRQEILNNIRIAAGQPYEPRTIRDDVATLYRLGHFESVEATAEILPDGAVEVVYRMTEQALILDLQVIGNKLISDQELRAVIPLYAGGPRDDFLLEQSVLRIKDLYKQKGHYLVEVTVDESRLRDTGILILRIIEGPRVRVKEIEFVGNDAIPAKRLSAQIGTSESFGIFSKGLLDPEGLIDDAASLDRFYRDQGYVDVRTDWRIQLSPDSREAKVTFVISEGRRYRLRNILIRGSGVAGPTPLEVFSPQQIEALVVLQPGEVFRAIQVRRSIEAVRNAYLAMGYVDANVSDAYARTGESAEVDLLLTIFEGEPAVTGLVLVQGNLLTKDKVIRRLVRIRPGRPLDGRELELAEQRIRQTNLFNDVRATIQDPRPGSPNVRDLLIEVKEKDTGSVNFGVGLGSDSGIFGEISVNQRNFDIADPPLTLDELVQGRAFRGAGQTFSLAITPGTEVSNYSISFGDPHLFETDIAANVSALYRNRIFTDYDENRYGFSLGLGRRLGDRWNLGLSLGWQRVSLTNFDPNTPIEVFNDRGPTNLPSIGVSMVRTTVDDFLRPTRGTRINLGVQQFLSGGGDDGGSMFTTVTAGVTSFFTLDEDYLGRRSVLRLSGDLGYIFGGDAPVYERFYLGGRSFRGFEFRTISPKATGTIGAPTTPINEPVGGDFLFFLGAQYEVPLVDEFLAGVVFVDSGTVDDEVSLGEYRVSVGVGIRLFLDALGPAPLAFDLGFPILKQEEDLDQLISFSAELPF